MMNNLEYQSKRAHLEWIRPGKLGGLPDWYYKVYLYEDIHGHIYLETTSTSAEMIKWCENNCKDTWGTYGFGTPDWGRTFFFIDKDDCVMFKLVWG